MKLTENSIMLFGKHKGKKLSERPNGYFLYLYDRKIIKGDLKKYVENLIPMLKTKYLSK
jgi:uncharacterized protein (DUF3820 family)